MSLGFNSKDLVILEDDAEDDSSCDGEVLSLGLAETDGQAWDIQSELTDDDEMVVLAPFHGGDKPSDGDMQTHSAEFKEAQSKTAALEAQVEKNVEEMTLLFAKLESSEDNRQEKDQLEVLNSGIEGLKVDIAESKKKEYESEMKMLRSIASKKVKEIEVSMKEKSAKDAVHAVSAAERVDLAFVVDITSSMGSYIAVVKENIHAIVRSIKETHGDFNLRLAMVGYRGIRAWSMGRRSKPIEILDFVTSVDEFDAFLGRIETWGGDGATADMALGVLEATRLSWEQPTRLTFLIADVPCHGREFHKYSDKYPSGTPGIDIKADLKRLLRKMNGGTSSLTFCRLTHYTDTMIAKFMDCGIAIDVSEIGDASKVAGSIVSSVRRSIFRTVTCSMVPGKSLCVAPIPELTVAVNGDVSIQPSKELLLKKYRVDRNSLREDDWKLQDSVSVKLYRNLRVKSVADLQAPIPVGIFERVTRYIFGAGAQAEEEVRRTDETRVLTWFMRRAPDPFGEGETRIAYHGQLSSKESRLGDKKNAVVLKTFKYHCEGLNDSVRYFKQMEVSTIAHFLAKKYNASHFRPSGCAKVRFLQVSVVEEESDRNEDSGNRRFCAEEILPSNGTEFTRFSNNTGQWDEDHLDETLLRFTDFTHRVSNGYLVVADLQGVKTDKGYYLTDPVILCKDILRFGWTNLGQELLNKTIESTHAYMKQNRWIMPKE